MNFTLSRVSQGRLGGVHPDLVKVVRRAILLSAVDFMITEGLRSLEHQKANLAAGKSLTLNSMHLVQPDGFGHAVDVCALVNGKASWDWLYYERINMAFQSASEDFAVPITWGGSWSSLKDGCHFELYRGEYL